MGWVADLHVRFFVGEDPVNKVEIAASDSLAVHAL
jgi:hypothetical protein